MAYSECGVPTFLRLDGRRYSYSDQGCWRGQYQESGCEGDNWKERSQSITEWKPTVHYGCWTQCSVVVRAGMRQNVLILGRKTNDSILEAKSLILLLGESQGSWHPYIPTLHQPHTPAYNIPEWGRESKIVCNQILKSPHKVIHAYV